MPSSQFNLAGMFIVGAIVLLLGLIVVTAGQLMSSDSEVMPAHGYSKRFDERPSECNFTVRNISYNGHVLVVLTQNGATVMEALVCEGMDATFSGPEGTYTVSYRAGDASDWNGHGFAPELRILKTRRNFKLEPGRNPRLTIPPPSPADK